MALGIDPGPLLARRPTKVAAIALANKLARMAWAIMAKGERYKEPAALASGKTVFGAYCVACHGPDGGGVIGPNLTDAFWIHGGSPSAIYATVHDGVLAKGMPAWGQSLKPDEVTAVVAYVISLQGTTPATPKPPEGTADTAAAAPVSGS